MKHATPLLAISFTLLAACTAQLPSNMEEDTSSSDAAMGQSNGAMMAGSQSSEPEVVTLEGDAFTIKWTTSDPTTDSTDVPRMKVLVNITGTEAHAIELGTYVGSALTVPATTREAVPGAIASASMWWAGGGEEFFVVKDGDTLLLQHRTDDEQVGYGPLETLQRITLSPGATVTVE